MNEPEVSLRRRHDDVDTVTELLADMAQLPAGPRRNALRDEAIGRAMPFVARLARRFRGRGEAMDDLVQVGSLALIRAVDGFDPDRGVPFSSYLTPTVVGELKRHFRDHGWDVRVSRALQERWMNLQEATARLTQQLGRAPQVHDLAVDLDISVGDVRDGLAAAGAYSCTSLNSPVGDGPDAPQRQDLLGGPDTALENVADLQSLRSLMQRLPARERTVLGHRFFDDMSQSQIAAEIGVSQMHVSRLLTRALAWLRDALVDGADTPYPYGDRATVPQTAVGGRPAPTDMPRPCTAAAAARSRHGGPIAHNTGQRIPHRHLPGPTGEAVRSRPTVGPDPLTSPPSNRRAARTRHSRDTKRTRTDRRGAPSAHRSPEVGRRPPYGVLPSPCATNIVVGHRARAEPCSTAQCRAQDCHDP